MKIGDLAKLTRCPVETIRYYEREGLLPEATRSESNYRIYSPSHLERLTFIRNCRSLDMTLEEIRRLLQLRDAPQTNCHSVNALMDEHIEHVSERISSLQQLKQQLLNLRGQCQSESATACAILHELQTREPEADSTTSHIGHSHTRAP